MSDAVDKTLKLWSEPEADDASRGLEVTREPDLGFVWPIYRWARGEAPAKALASAHNVEGEMPVGDFGRWARQVVDLLGQRCDARGASAEVRGAVRQAMAASNRGILAYNAVTWRDLAGPRRYLRRPMV